MTSDGRAFTSTDGLALAADAAVAKASRTYFDSRRERVPQFVRKNFGLLGTIRLHSAAFGWDLLRAPANVLLSPVYLLTKLAAWVAGKAGLRRLAGWLGSRRILLTTAVGAEVERRVVVELLELPWPGEVRLGRDALSRTLLADPNVHALIREAKDDQQVEALHQHMLRSIGEYSGTRAAVAEMTTALGTLGTGAVAFQSLTPGMVSLAPALSFFLAHQAAIAAFPMGAMLGSAWYRVFPTEVPFWLSAGTTLGLIMFGALCAAFAGIIADPIQTLLGIHQRRLHRLIDALERSFTGASTSGFIAREHYFARLLDLTDAGLSAVRVLRG